MENRIARQCEAIAEIEQLFQQNIAHWGYESLYVYPRDFPTCPFPREDQNRLHAIALFHQRIENEERAIVPRMMQLFDAQLICSKKTQQSDVEVKVVHYQGQYYFLRTVPNSNETQIIEWIDAEGIPYQGKTPEQLQQCFSQAIFSLKPLDDGAHKLYIQLTLPAGMMENDVKALVVENLGLGNPLIPTATIADHLLRSVPPNSYSSVLVERIYYRFPAMLNEKSTICITLKVESWDWCINILKTLSRQPIRGINHNRVIRGLLGSRDPIDQEEARKVYKTCYTFVMYVSDDLENFHPDPKADRIISSIETFTGGVITFGRNIKWFFTRFWQAVEPDPPEVDPPQP
jgi:hypothetical protein